MKRCGRYTLLLNLSVAASVLILAGALGISTPTHRRRAEIAAARKGPAQQPSELAKENERLGALGVTK